MCVQFGTRQSRERDSKREGKFGNDEMGVEGKEMAKDLDFEKKRQTDMMIHFPLFKQ